MVVFEGRVIVTLHMRIMRMLPLACDGFMLFSFEGIFSINIRINYCTDGNYGMKWVGHGGNND